MTYKTVKGRALNESHCRCPLERWSLSLGLDIAVSVQSECSYARRSVQPVTLFESLLSATAREEFADGRDRQAHRDLTPANAS